MLENSVDHNSPQVKQLRFADADLSIGARFWVMLAGKLELVELVEGHKNGSRFYNARKLTGRNGLTFVSRRAQIQLEVA